MPEQRKKEIRIAELRALPQIPDQPDMIVEGYALVFEKPTVLWTDRDSGKEYKEIISRGALDGVDLSDVPFKYNHGLSGSMVMARTRSKTLTLSVDDVGLKFSANLAPTTDGKDLYTLVQRGDIDKMSFAFLPAADTFDRNTTTRRINKFEQIGDISAVESAAYEQTSISARSYCEGQKEAEVMQAKQAQKETKRKRLLLRTYFSVKEERHAIPFQKTQVIDEPWDGPKNKANLNTGPDVKADYYRRAFAWVDPDANPDTKAAYKFIHHDVTAGGVIGPANVKGCQSGIGVLNGGMGGTKIPDGDKQGVYDHLAEHLRDAKVDPPELRSAQGAFVKDNAPAGDGSDMEDDICDCPIDLADEQCLTCSVCGGACCTVCGKCYGCGALNDPSNAGEDQDVGDNLRRKKLMLMTYL